MQNELNCLLTIDQSQNPCAAFALLRKDIYIASLDEK